MLQLLLILFVTLNTLSGMDKTKTISFSLIDNNVLSSNNLVDSYELEIASPPILNNDVLNTKKIIAHFMLNKKSISSVYAYIKRLILNTSSMLHDEIFTQDIEKILDTMYFNIGNYHYDHKHCSHKNNIKNHFECAKKNGITLIDDERKEKEGDDLHFAIMHNNFTFFKLLFKNTSNKFLKIFFDKLLYASLIKGKINFLTALLAYDETAIDFRTKNKNSPWHFVITQTDTKEAILIFQLLVKYYEKKHKTHLILDTILNEEKDTPLHIACKYYCQNTRTDTLEFVLKNYKKFNINAQNENKETPLMLACIWDCDEYVDLLIDEGADVNMQDILGNTAAHRTCLHKNLKSLTALLECKKININLKNKQGSTALATLINTIDLTIKKQDEKIIAMVKLLLTKHADPLLKDNNNETALSLAQKRASKNKNEKNIITQIIEILSHKKRESIIKNIKHKSLKIFNSDSKDLYNEFDLD